MAKTIPKQQRRFLLFWLILSALLLLALEAITYVGLTLVNQKRNIFYGSRGFTADMGERLVKNSFDPVLGWNLSAGEANNLGTRRRQDYPPKPVYKLKAFGDSFVYGAEVEPESTVCAFVERLRPWECLNFGVGAYGTDQALLKYRANPIKSEYVVLGILCENIGRVVSRYPGFYMRLPFPPKPRYLWQQGRARLLPNPISEKQQLYRLLDPAFIESLKQDDYWPYYYEQVMRAPDRLRFPALYTLFRHAGYFASLASIPLQSWLKPSFEADQRKYKYYHLYQSDSEALRLMKYLIDEFARLAGERQEKPVFIVFADQYSLDLMKRYHRTPYAALSDYIQSQGYPLVDVGASFSQEPYEKYFNYYNSHYSPAGNKRVADLLIQLIEQEAVQADGKISLK
jgi:hypothetical protein